MSSDDQGSVFLSSDDQPANKYLLCYEPQWNNARDYTGTARRNPSAPENKSTNITLLAGQRYYLEAVMKEGGGGNNLSVAVQEPGQGTPVLPIASTRFAPVRYRGAQTFFTLGAVLFTKQPVNTSVNENAAAALTCSLMARRPMRCSGSATACRGGRDQPPTSHRRSAAPAANYSNGGNEFSTATSTNVRVTVVPDDAPA
jgi:hypothetical protein